MLTRFKRIHREFGFSVSSRIVLLLVGLVGMSLLGAIELKSFWAALVAIVGLALGGLLRRRIVDWFGALSWTIPMALFIFGLVMFIGERLGLSPAARLLIITLTTVIVFNLQFWWFSDPSVVRDARETKVE